MSPCPSYAGDIQEREASADKRAGDIVGILAGPPNSVTVVVVATD
jgi:hypothetical protein